MKAYYYSTLAEATKVRNDLLRLGWTCSTISRSDNIDHRGQWFFLTNR